METSRSAEVWGPAKAQALRYAWSQYRIWAATARRKKAEMTAWRQRVLLLTIIGASLATLSHQIAALSRTASWIIGILGGGLIAIATYLGHEILKPDQERIHVRARSLAEALKSEVFLFRTETPPYDSDQASAILLARVKSLLDRGEDLPAVVLTEEEALAGLPQGALSIEDYIKERVDDQVNGFYRPRARRFGKLLRRWRGVSLLVGAAAALFGAASVAEDVGKWAAGWVAVLTTVGTAVASHVFASRYQYLVTSYQATARELDFLKHEWTVLGAPAQDAEKRHQFVAGCERAISVENSAWMAKWIEDEQAD
jgi:hypothetical protein